MNVEETLETLGETVPNIFVVQIGAMDGVSFDDLSKYITRFNWGGLFVEPMPEMFSKLINFRAESTGMLFENSAISDYDGEIEMIRIPPATVTEDKLPMFFNGMSAVYPPKNGLKADVSFGVTIKEYVEKIKVPCITLDTLFKKHSIQNVDILCIDAEGHDWTIFKQFDLDKYKPKFIKIEFTNLDAEEKELLKEKLKTSAYEYKTIGMDIYAKHEHG